MWHYYYATSNAKITASGKGLLMLSLEEFLNLILNADDEVIDSVVRILEESQQQTEPQE